MCYSYSIQKMTERYLRRIPQGGEIDNIYFTSGFNHPLMPIITNTKTLRIENAHWGLIPKWAKDKSIQQYTLNARSETIFEKPSFKDAIMSQRCLVPANGFFEWKLVNGKKYPHFITLANNAQFMFAGICDSWLDGLSGNRILSYSIITTKAFGLMAEIHNTKKRMPLILPSDIEFDWLQKGLSQEGIKNLLAPMDESLLKAITIAPKPINHPKSLEEYCYPELKQGSLF